MKPIARLIAMVALGATIAPPVWFLFTKGGNNDLELVKQAMLIATVVWFVAATLWLWEDDEQAPEHVVPTVDDDEAAVI